MIFENAEKHVFTCLLAGLWLLFGAFLDPLSFLWRAGVILLDAFGSPGLSVGSGTAPRPCFAPFSNDFGDIF